MKNNRDETLGVFIQEKVSSKTAWANLDTHTHTHTHTQTRKGTVLSRETGCGGQTRGMLKQAVEGRQGEC